MYSLLATFAFPHDYWQEKPENRRHYALPHSKIHAVSKDSNDVRGPSACTQEVPAIAATTANTQEHIVVVVFASPSFYAKERCVDLCVVFVIVVIVFEGRFFNGVVIPCWVATVVTTVVMR